MIEINLLEQRKKFSSPIVAGIDLKQFNFKAIFIAILFFYIPKMFIGKYFTQEVDALNAKVLKLRQTQKKISKELRENKNALKEMDSYKNQVANLKEKSEKVDKLLKTKTNPKFLMEKIARMIPQDVWLDRLEINSAKDLKLAGGANSYSSIGRFLNEANNIGVFEQELKLFSSQTVNEKIFGRNVRTDSFELRGRVKVFDPYLQ